MSITYHILTAETKYVTNMKILAKVRKMLVARETGYFPFCSKYSAW